MVIMKKISILGSTGSIGTQTLSVVRENDDIIVTALAARSNIVLLEQQIRELKPKLVAVYDEKMACKLKNMIKDLDVKVAAGMDGLIQCATYNEADMVVSAVVGMIGILPTIEAIKAGKDIAFANKETLVTAGHIIMPMVKEYGISFLPVDSEHSAIFQSVQGKIPYDEYKNSISRILLTASGGPFRGKKRAELTNITVKDALKHPNWVMGPKITIDSATMVNKGLEIIEAKWLFDVPLESIEVVIQPQSLIHSAVEFIDGSIIAQMGTPDMKLPIQYALYYPERKQLRGERVNFDTLTGITFEKPDYKEFIGLALAINAAKAGGSMPTVFNAANELAVELFLNNKISYLSITDLIKAAMKQHKMIDVPSFNDILNTEQETYDYINTLVYKRKE